MLGVPENVLLPGPEPALGGPKFYNKNISQFTDLKTEVCELLKDGEVKVLPMTDSITEVFISSWNTL